MTTFLEFGIDLGTTNSCIARFEHETLRVFQNNDLMNVTPSAVRVLKNGRVIVGKKAVSALVEDPDNVATEFKRWMGQKEAKTFPSSRRVMSPEELSAEVLKAMNEDALRATGSPIDAAVITVPAAFDTLQCEATSRAATMAGIRQCALLQEPIAAAIAYGASPASRDERWLVYDLGGGTFDVAVTSTRDGRLSVLEHRGDNLLGGKDIDRALVETCMLPKIGAVFHLPDPEDDFARFETLFRRLRAKAEEAKIELSSAPTATVSLFDVGTDMDGQDIEIEFLIDQAELAAIAEPLLRRTFQLTEEALDGARLRGQDLTRVLLVGGPTQMPFLRTALAERLQAPVDHSMDPMTVVARGAAMYAQSVERAVEAAPVAAPDVLVVRLVYDPVSALVQAPVAGRFENPPTPDLEVRIDSEAGYWTSGWLPVRDAYFALEVVLQEGRVCPFTLYVRDGEGQILNVEPSSFTIRHGLELSAPPLPHTIALEVVRPNGRTELDPIFPRSTPLPAEKRLVYRAGHTLRPGDETTAITVKLWEGEDLTEPQANSWVGNAQITPRMVRRPIPEDSEIEVFIRIDTSRLIAIEIFVPHLNQHFTEGVYLAVREQQDEADAASKLSRHIEIFTEHLGVLEDHLGDEADPEFESSFRALRRQLEDLDIDVTIALQRQGLSDPDRAHRLVARARDIRSQISALEHRIGADRRMASQALQARETLDTAAGIVAEYGETIDHYEFNMLRKDFEAAAARLDERGVQRCITELDKLRFRVLSRQPAFWIQAFESLDKSEGAFSNPNVAQVWVDKGTRAVQEGKVAALEEAVRKLWDLLPRSAAQQVRQSALKTGLRS